MYNGHPESLTFKLIINLQYMKWDFFFHICVLHWNDDKYKTKIEMKYKIFLWINKIEII